MGQGMYPDFAKVAEGLERAALEPLRDPQPTSADARTHDDGPTTADAIPDAATAKATSKRSSAAMSIVAIVLASLVVAIALAGALVGTSHNELPPDAATQEAIARAIMKIPTVSRW